MSSWCGTENKRGFVVPEVDKRHRSTSLIACFIFWEVSAKSVGYIIWTIEIFKKFIFVKTIFCKFLLLFKTVVISSYQSFSSKNVWPKHVRTEIYKWNKIIALSIRLRLVILLFLRFCKNKDRHFLNSLREVIQSKQPEDKFSIINGMTFYSYINAISSRVYC